MASNSGGAKQPGSVGLGPHFGLQVPTGLELSCPKSSRGLPQQKTCNRAVHSSRSTSTTSSVAGGILLVLPFPRARYSAPIFDDLVRASKNGSRRGKVVVRYLVAGGDRWRPTPNQRAIKHVRAPRQLPGIGRMASPTSENAA